MDTLHHVLRSIRTETKSAPRHLTVFREFLAQLDQLQRQAPTRPSRVKSSAPRRSSKRSRRA